MGESNPKNGCHGDLAAPKDGLTPGSIREKVRFIRRAGNNYQLGSNIACLHSHDVDQRGPSKPSHRVRDVGREIMLQANVCSWYPGMTETDGLEEFRGGRRLLQREKYTPASMPSLFRGDEMTSPNPTNTKYPARSNPIIHSPEPTPEKKSTQERNCSPEKKPSIPPSVPVNASPKKTASHSGVAVKKETAVKDSSPAVSVPPVEAQKPPETSFSGYSVETSVSWLKRLEEQQIELMRQQQELNEKLRRKLSGHEKPIESFSSVADAQPSPSPPSPPTVKKDLLPRSVSEMPLSTYSLADSEGLLGTPSVTKSVSMARSGASSRRLKGAVAQRCAQRDEGSIKDLIWFQDPDTDDNDGNNNKTTCRSLRIQPAIRNDIIGMTDEFPTNVVKRSSCAVKAENSKTVQDLISNSFSAVFS